jgi:hypothetical protein
MPKKRKELSHFEPVEPLIREIRGERVMLDSDLARIYGVPTFRFNEAVKRNLDRFPGDFRFQLTQEEAISLRSQIAILKKGRGRHRKYLPYAFTEHGAIMAANILNSPQAVQMSVFVVRAFVALRRDIGRYSALRRKLSELERTQKLQGDSIETILEALRLLEETTSWAYPEGRRLIGFRPRNESKHIPHEQ